MKISVIIPTYKPEGYLTECLESLGRQTLDRESFEVVLVLNGCNEPWASKVKRTMDDCLRGNHVTFIQTDRPGVSNARNIGIENSRGEFLTFLDDDDYVSPRYLELLLEHATEDTVSASDSYAFVEETGEHLEKYEPHANYKRIQGHGRVGVLAARSIYNGSCMKLIHRKILGDMRFNTKLANSEDSLLMLQITKNIRGTVAAAPEAIYFRRFRNGGAYLREKSIWKILEVWRICSWEYSKCFLMHPTQYRPTVVARYVMAATKNLVEEISRKILRK